MPHHALAVAFLCLLAVLPPAAFIAWARTTPFRGFKAFLYLLVTLLVRVQWRANVPRWPLPPGQGAILVCNHRSSVDPFFLQMAAPGVVHWMVAREYCEHPACAWFLRLAAVIPTRRGGIDTAATKSVIRLAAAGELIGMLPEGRINHTDELLVPCRPGAVLAALKARVPIVPCYLEGAPYHRWVGSPFLMTAHVRVHLGAPLDLSPYYGREHEEGLVGQLMLEVLQALARLADREDFQPRLAGRRWNVEGEPFQATACSSSNRQDPRGV